MEQRKVQVTGGSTFIVSLPKKWVDAQGIRPGDALDVHAEPNGPVTIYPSGSRPGAPRSLTLTLEPSDPSSYIERQIIAAYLAGYETIIIQSPARFPPDHKQGIRTLAQTLIGIEIVEETQRHIVLQDLLDPLDFDLNRAIERMEQLARTMVADALAALRSDDEELARDIPLRDPEVDRLDWMITKQFHLVSSSGRLAGSLNLGPSDALHHLLVSVAIERIADHAGRLAQILLEPGTKTLNQPSRQALSEYGDAILRLLDAAFAAFRTSDVRAANDTLTACREVSKEAAKLLARGKGQPAGAQVSLALLVKSIERVRSYTMDIAEAAIDEHMVRIGRHPPAEPTARRSG